MSLLYITSAQVRELHVLKFGITKFATQHARILSHETSRDNPFGSRLGAFTDVAVIRAGGRYPAIFLETMFRRASRAAFPVIRNPWAIKDGTFCLGKSGEWIGQRPDCFPASCARPRLQHSVDQILFEIGFGLEAQFQRALQRVLDARMKSDDLVELDLEPN